MKLGLLVSGNLGNIILTNLYSDADHSISFVFTDSKSTGIIEFCNLNGISLFVGNPRNGKASQFLKTNENPEVILSVNYLFIVEKDIINKADKYAINVHGSLLPKYRGRTPHVWAIINNEKITGITAHLIDEGCDEGDIILQEKVEILDSYTGQDLLNIFNIKYQSIIIEVLKKIQNNTIQFIKQDNSKATFFEKRTEVDGMINFDWQKESIYNWIRAQAKPYPGAYCYINEKKIKIHKVEFSDMGYRQTMPNGIIVSIQDNLPYFKTQNGVLKILEFEYEHTIKVGDLLN